MNTRRRSIFFLYIRRRLTEIWRERCDVDEGCDARVIPCLRDDRPAIAMADEHYRTWLMVDHACDGIDIVCEPAQGILHGDDTFSFGLQQRANVGPGCPINTQ